MKNQEEGEFAPLSFSLLPVFFFQICPSHQQNRVINNIFFTPTHFNTRSELKNFLRFLIIMQQLDQ